MAEWHVSLNAYLSEQQQSMEFGKAIELRVANCSMFSEAT